MAAAPPGNSGAGEWQASVALFTAGEVALLKEVSATSGLVVRVQALTALRNPGAAAGVEEAGADVVPGQAWVCLGKLCLSDEALAKRCLPLFVQVGGEGSFEGGHPL